jgi:VCBS repeat-containing protein
LSQPACATANAGTSFTKQGTHGTATLTVATNTVAHQLDNTLAATQALAAGAQASDSFDVHVIDGALVCPYCKRSYPIKKGIPNMLLREDEL